MNNAAPPVPQRGDGGHAMPRIVHVLDPRFPGGTSSAVAQELDVLSALYRPRISAISSAMFKGHELARPLEQVVRAKGVTLEWDPKVISADLVIVHNPSFLKFQSTFDARIIARRLIVVTHENFLRPGGEEGFDVAACLGMISRASLVLDKVLAPVSPSNRDTILQWMGGENARDHHDWRLADDDWFNICDFPIEAPNAAPGDRRGRLSRPGFEKFPALDAMEACFPPTAERNVILGADTLMPLGADHPHWQLIPFRGLEIAEFFRQIDFFVYFTAPVWQESFGRVIAEAIAAGKLVLTDSRTAANFGDSVISTTPAGVDELIAHFVRNPDRYAAQVRRGQAGLARFSGARFRKVFERHVMNMGEAAL